MAGVRIPGRVLNPKAMNNKKFWWLLTLGALVATFLYLIACMVGDRSRIQRIENHSELTKIDSL